MAGCLVKGLFTDECEVSEVPSATAFTVRHKAMAQSSPRRRRRLVNNGVDSPGVNTQTRQLTLRARAQLTASQAPP